MAGSFFGEDQGLYVIAVADNAGLVADPYRYWTPTGRDSRWLHGAIGARGRLLGDPGMTIGRRILIATAIAGTLDIAAAMLLSFLHSGTFLNVLRTVASGPFPDAKWWGIGGAMLGLGIHYFLMAIMAAVFVLAAQVIPALRKEPLIWGAIYGDCLWMLMYFAVLPARFGAPLPQDLGEIFTQLVCHIALVGIPIALVARRL
ncbi:MAG: hypothetical protein EOP62_00165 [Sphingomonadales bacterium]|nr:MAG: hypothetical protein EOP62_00165 [Sphingomonadales bacterium]